MNSPRPLEGPAYGRQSRPEHCQVAYTEDQPVLMACASEYILLKSKCAGPGIGDGAPRQRHCSCQEGNSITSNRIGEMNRYALVNMLSSTRSFMLSIKEWTFVAEEPGGEGGPVSRSPWGSRGGVWGSRGEVAGVGCRGVALPKDKGFSVLALA